MDTQLSGSVTELLTPMEKRISNSANLTHTVAEC
jgi:hypothetical protein